MTNLNRKSIIIDIDQNGEIIDWSNRDKIKRCILDLVSLCKRHDNVKIKELKQDLGLFSFQKEFGLVKLSTARQSGSTQAQLQILREYENVCMICLSFHIIKYLQRYNTDIKNKICHTSKFINESKHYEIVLVDNASHNENVDRIIENCSYMDNCVCVLIG